MNGGFQVGAFQTAYQQGSGPAPVPPALQGNPGPSGGGGQGRWRVRKPTREQLDDEDILEALIQVLANFRN